MSNDCLRDGRTKNWFYMENNLLDRQDLNIYEKMIYIVIARFVDKEDKAFPSVPTIAKKGSMSERQVQAIINSLVKKKSVNRIVNNQKEDSSLMVNRRRDKDYIRKVIRISQKYIVLCDFLDFYAGYKEINEFEFYNNLFNYSLSKISSDLGYKFKKPAVSVYRITRSFFLNKKTYDLLNTTYNKYQQLYKSLYDDYLSLGNFTELTLYIYINDNIDKKILNLFKFGFGIKKII